MSESIKRPRRRAQWQSPEGAGTTLTAADWLELHADVAQMEAKWAERMRQRLTNPTRALHPDPEDTCERCLRQCVSWFAPSPIWNDVIRVPQGRRDYEEWMLCPVCFIKAAEAVGINTSWRVSPMNYEGPDDDPRIHSPSWLLPESDAATPPQSAVEPTSPASHV